MPVPVPEGYDLTNPDIYTFLHNPDLAGLASAAGLTGIRIDDPLDLADGVAAAFSTRGPVLVDIVTNPNEIALPPNPSPGDAWGFAIAKVKEALRSRGEED